MGEKRMENDPEMNENHVSEADKTQEKVTFLIADFFRFSSNGNHIHSKSCDFFSPMESP